MQTLRDLVAAVTESYENFAFHRVFSLIYNFCSVEMSSIYMDVLKDRLYCDPADSPGRRSSQTAMYRILDALIRLLTPILAHTCEEAWAALNFKAQDTPTIHLAAMPKPQHYSDVSGDMGKWEKLLALRDEVLRVLEGLRRDKKIASNQEASVSIAASDEEVIKLLEDFGFDQFASLCIVSEVTLEKTQGPTAVTARKSPHLKCARCWNYWSTVGADSRYPDLCKRCVDVMLGDSNA